MKPEAFVQALERLAPPEYAEAWDNVGLLIDPPGAGDVVRRALLTIDFTDAVADEAVERDVDFVVSYHPVLFRPARRLDVARAHDRAVMKAVAAGIRLYSPHTALDAVRGGTNDWLAEGVGAGAVSVLAPLPGTDAGAGRLVELREPAALEEILRRVKRHLGIEMLRLARAEGNAPVRRIALCAGAGADVLRDVAADLLLSGEMGHHDVLAAVRNGRHVALCEHTRTERGFLARFRERLLQRLRNDVDVLLSERDADPVEYH